MTSFDKVYDAFLAKILEDEWNCWTEEEMRQDLKVLLLGSLIWFKFPRVSLDYDDEYDYFYEELNNTEIQILATYMKCEWLNRTILTWENIKPLYEERDFSQANMLDKLNNTLAAERKNARQLEAKYYRSIDYKPFHYNKLYTKL